MTDSRQSGDGMDVLALRYVADRTENGDPMVLDVSSDPARVVCGCRRDSDAEMVARALNQPEARDAAEAIVTALCEITGEPVPEDALMAVRVGLHDPFGGR